jgi:hypothetical protein
MCKRVCIREEVDDVDVYLELKVIKHELVYVSSLHCIRFKIYAY